MVKPQEKKEMLLRGNVKIKYYRFNRLIFIIFLIFGLALSCTKSTNPENKPPSQPLNNVHLGSPPD